MRKLIQLSGLMLALLVALGSSSSGDDDDDDDDDIIVVDASTAPDSAAGDPDAATGGFTLGETCNGTMGMADCAAGLECLSLQGGTNPWCSEMCTPGTACGAGYTGPGDPNCYLGVDFGGGDIRNFCGVICEDIAGGICPTCNGTCPGTLACTADLMDNSTPPVLVARGCQ